MPRVAGDRYCAVTMSQGTFRGGLSGSVRAVVVAALAVALAAGCTTPDDEPTPTAAPATPVPEPEPEPAEQLPEEPEAPLPRTGTPDERDAEAAGEFFLRLYEYTLLTGDTEQWEERSLPGCEFCANVVADVDAYRSEGARFVDLEFTVEPARFVAFEDVLVMFAVEVPYEQSATKVVKADGSVVKEFGGGSGFLLLEMAYAPESGWLLRTGNDRDESWS